MSKRSMEQEVNNIAKLDKFLLTIYFLLMMIRILSFVGFIWGMYIVCAYLFVIFSTGLETSYATVCMYSILSFGFFVCMKYLDAYKFVMYLDTKTQE